MRKLPVIAIIGTTGTGKSKLAINLAKNFNGEIINADAMQMYAGLNIITNKVTTDEMCGVKHHLFDIIPGNNVQYTFHQFERDGIATIQDIHSRNKVPIIVGGTHYYIQLLLWDESIPESTPPPTTQINTDLAQNISSTLESIPVFNASTEQKKVLHDLLGTVDPVMAIRWHPNDDRKVRRALDVYLKTGTKQSDIFKLQRQTSAKLRFPTLFFWVYTDFHILDTRLNNRVDAMLENGLVEEITDTFAQYASGTEPIDYNRGIFQSIGFKEFESYFQHLRQNQSSPPDLSNIYIPSAQESSWFLSPLHPLISSGLYKMKATTRQYARKQLRWIKNNLFPYVYSHQYGKSEEAEKDYLGFHALDSSDLSKWDEFVESEAFRATEGLMLEQYPAPFHATTPLTKEILDSYLSSQMTPQQSGSDDDEHDPLLGKEWQKYVCKTCVDKRTGKFREMNGIREWEEHLKSRGHRNVLESIRKGNYMRGKKWEELRKSLESEGNEINFK
ncbi:hypothetical protein HK098_004186 [Nowakowskiella sp. JEL0407]|nr:hypothetical protein HK098_004186 [Nowakowskiella sp. JEL0407]